MAIEESEVPQVFNDECIAELIRIGLGLRLGRRSFLRRPLRKSRRKSPREFDREFFAKSVRNDVVIYVRADVVRGTKLREQISELRVAADKKDYEGLARALEGLSPIAHGWLNDRRAHLGIGMPSAVALRDSLTREEACSTIASLCRSGGVRVEGRLRSPGKRSMTVRWGLYGPEPPEKPPEYDPDAQPRWRYPELAKAELEYMRNVDRRWEHPPIREAELEFVRNLRLTWMTAGGEVPNTAGRFDGSIVGPFPKLVARCLQLVGSHADPVALINALNTRRQDDVPKWSGECPLCGRRPCECDSPGR